MKQKRPAPVPSTSRGSKGSPAAVSKKRSGSKESNGGKAENNKVARVAANGDNDAVAVDRAVLDMLECPVCMELVRIGRPVYSCSNGHIVCNSCHEGVRGTCPTCRDKTITVNKYVERMAAETLKNVTIKCAFSGRGCSVRLPMSAMDAHEAQCNFRDHPCVAGMYLGDCDWVGSAHQLASHVRRERQCFSMCAWDAVDGRRHSYSFCAAAGVERGLGFEVAVGEDGEAAEVVADEDAWLVPSALVCLDSRDEFRFVLYLFACRRVDTGDTCIFARAFGPEELIKAARVTIEASKGEAEEDEEDDNGEDEDEDHDKDEDDEEEEEEEDGDNDDDNDSDDDTPAYRYRGGIYPISADEKNSIRLDRALVIKHEQVKALYRGDALFNCKVTLDLPEEETRPARPKR